ncbi:MAG: hypothetical protein GY759_12790 [Chloroflexi bacterium]|nr:hypothetical protein [Chloroflexota bacterium]
MSNIAMFAGLVVDEKGETLEVAWVGSDACYVIDDGDFRRHIDAEEVDRQVLKFFKEQVEAHRDVAVRGILDMMGKDDIFSKTAVEYSINQMDEAVGQQIPPQARDMLRSMGFKILIDFHGKVIDVELPEGDIEL